MRTGGTVVITGVAGDMGAAFVPGLLDNGHVVVATDRAEEGLAWLAGSVSSARLHTRSADVTRKVDNIIGLSRSLAREFGAGRVCVSIVASGVTIADPAEKVLPQSIQDDAMEARYLKRKGHAQDITGAVFFLASPEVDFITRQTIINDGPTRCSGAEKRTKHA